MCCADAMVLIANAFFNLESGLSWPSMVHYHGVEHSQVHIRTMFEDIEHGSEMQMSTFLFNFHESVLLEKRVPEELVLGADNTSKETKNKYGTWWCMWLLCLFLVADVPLHSILMVFLLVGHTHDEIDRFFPGCVWR